MQLGSYINGLIGIVLAAESTLWFLFVKQKKKQKKET